MECPKKKREKRGIHRSSATLLLKDKSLRTEDTRVLWQKHLPRKKCGKTDRKLGRPLSQQKWAWYGWFRTCKGQCNKLSDLVDSVRWLVSWLATTMGKHTINHKIGKKTHTHTYSNRTRVPRHTHTHTDTRRREMAPYRQKKKNERKQISNREKTRQQQIPARTSKTSVWFDSMAHGIAMFPHPPNKPPPPLLPTEHNPLA